jgi:hypothetical protein
MPTQETINAAIRTMPNLLGLLVAIWLLFQAYTTAEQQRVRLTDLFVENARCLIHDERVPYPTGRTFPD